MRMSVGHQAELGSLLANIRPIQVSTRVTRINISGPVAWVHGIETSRRRTKTGEVSNNRNFGTNIFVIATAIG